MKNLQHYSILLLLTLCFSNLVYAQLPTASLKSKQPSHLFKSVIITTNSDSTVVGFGFVNPIDYSELIFTRNKPNESVVEDWEQFDDIKNVKILGEDEILLEALNFKGKHKILHALVYESNRYKLYKSISIYTPDLYFFSDISSPDEYSMLILRKQRSFERSAKKIFKNCPGILESIKKGKFKNNEEGVIKLIEEFEKSCNII
ncbi:hypothetical protein [Mangrovivirga cuniculi]|uniref:DUF4369 domain-containing protein n=1 Tax=Mangrovivirga cuniculi TaxID=2715131 RepID=A0A4D7JSJ8_9BACT|nr:hypothetical protein [Mangrovivirga cuniculi]QCK16480.1 hypothetical protein DCC35_17965 [Mangrovivirga cuniculi]